MHSSGSTVDRGLLGERPDVVGGRVGHQRDEMGDVRRTDNLSMRLPGVVATTPVTGDRGHSSVSI